MVRTFDEEIQHRLELRKKYFEDPRYRRWSDVAPGEIGGRKYALLRDDRLFDYFITNQTYSHSSLFKLKMYLRDGYKLPINWSNFYAYFDARLNDPDNRFIDDLKIAYIRDESGRCATVEELLNMYRDELYHGYDII